MGINELKYEFYWKRLLNTGRKQTKILREIISKNTPSCKEKASLKLNYHHLS